MRLGFVRIGLVFSCAVILCVLASCSESKLQITKVHAAYSLLAPSESGDTILYARVILDGANKRCPVLTGNDQSEITMSVRGYHPDKNTASQNFPVTTCEAIIYPGISYAVSSDVSSSPIKIDAVTLNPSSVIVYGDTGCKTSQCKAGEAAKPFDLLAQAGVDIDADLILHMGDYNYRGTSGSIRKKPKKIYAYDAGDGGFEGAACGFVGSEYYSQNASDSPKPDSWKYWQDDFFKPAKNILPTAPWVFSRGNHELCSRAGLGWFYFFGPGSSLEGGVPQLVCPDQGILKSPPQEAKSHIVMIPPYMLALEPLKLWVVDSANACDASADNLLTAQYTRQFEQLYEQEGNEQENNEQTQNKPVWMVTHRPLWGGAVKRAKEDKRASLFAVPAEVNITPFNIMMQMALQNTPATRLPDSVKLILSGHKHLFQSVSFLASKTERPPQIIIGNSGVSLNKSPSGRYKTVIDDEIGHLNQLRQYGFLKLELKADSSWEGDVLDQSGHSIIHCDSKNALVQQSVCEINESSL